MPTWLLRSYNNIADFMEQLQRLVDEAADRYLIDFERIVANVSCVYRHIKWSIKY